MYTTDQLLAELKQEGANTRKMLSSVPFEKSGWKPHEKSMALGRLAIHLAENLRWAWYILESDYIDFANRPFGPSSVSNREELLGTFDLNYNKALQALEKAQNGDLNKKWTVKSGETLYMEPARGEAIKGWSINHNIHHRGQLSVYLRLLDIPVPGMYGPSADNI